jgi:hypothetical protein
MGAVSTRGAWRERRLAKRNSPLYGPRTALPSAWPASGRKCPFALVYQQHRWPGPGSATGGSTRHGPVADAAISGWRNCFLLRFGPAPEAQCYGLAGGCQQASDLPVHVSPQVRGTFRRVLCRQMAAGWRNVSAPGPPADQARRAPAEKSSSPFRTVCRQRGSVPVSSAGNSGVRARGSVLQDWTLPSATWTMSSSTSQTA